ncbi:MAG TPA: tetratricopeptide repeat protein [Anaerolineae bacterium]|nr:tetratricopeptide repeat protein [Anaerolineae bacterium]HMR64967.1 tetratricopeptide repeat protein [Anaerolineae bacterium]
MSQKMGVTMTSHHQEARDIPGALLPLEPNKGEDWYRLGALAWQQQKFEDARSYFEKCLAVTPDHVLAAKSLGGVLAQLGRLDEAVAAFRYTLRLNPADAESHTNLGALLGESGQLDEAVAELQRALQLEPGYARAFYNLGVTLEKQGRHDEALASYQQAAQCQPNNAQLYYNQGLIFKTQQRYDEAVAQFKQALQLNPLHLDARTTLGAVYGEQEQFEQAMHCFEQVLQHQPDHLGARFNQAVLFVQQNKTPQAMTCYQQILKIEPDHLGATINLGGLFLAQHDYATAEAYFRRAVTLDAACPEAYYGLWLVLMQQGHYEAGLFNFQRALSLRPLHTLWRLELDLFVPPIMPDEETIAGTRRYLEAIVRNYPPESIPLDQCLGQFKLSNANPPLDLVYHGKNDRELKERFATIFKVTAQPDRKAILKSRRHGQPYRVGFLIAKDHELGFNYFVSGLVNRLDPALFEPFILCDASNVPTLQAHLTHPHLKFAVFAADIQATAAKITALGLDLIYFWEIGTDALNYFLPFFRLAPVQCTSWGTPDTTGIRSVDYFISSTLFEPEITQNHYTEQLIRLHSLGVYYRRPRLENGLRGRAHFGFSERENLYFCTQSLMKFHPQFDGLLAEILRRDPQGKILVKARYNHLDETLRRRWQRRIPDVVDRIQFVPRQSYADYLNLMELADVLLDTIHYSGGTTSFEAIAVGTPIVTWPGEFMRGRMTYGCYRKIGVLDSVVSSAAEYVAKAVQLATDRVSQQQLRQKILTAGAALFEDGAAGQELAQFFAWAIEKARKESGDD